MELYKSGFFVRTRSLLAQDVRRAIRKQVMIDYQTEAEQVSGWRKYLLHWKLNTIVEIRFRGILFMGASMTL